jgi:hypothetical protein
MENKSEIQYVIQIIIDEFKFLEDFGFKNSISIPNSDVFLEYVKVEYKCADIKRIVCISYTMNEIFTNIKMTFDLSIVKMPYNDPDKDYFSQSIFIRSIGKELVASMVNKFSKEEAEEILRGFSRCLKMYSMKIVTGEVWEEGYYPKW